MISDFPHRIEHSRNRHSRAFLEGSTVVIRLAKNLSVTQQKDHIQNLLKRMIKQVQKEKKRLSIQPFEELLDGSSSTVISTVFDDQKMMTLEPGKRTKVKEKNDGWLVYISPQLNKPQLHRLLWKTVANSYRDILDDRIHLVNKRTLNVNVSATKIQYAVTQWGSCSSQGVIMLNTALLFTSEELLDYVIIHELAHCIRKDHSRMYWKVVEQVLPNYSDLRKKLRAFKLSAL